jgi:HD-GYP domain-containing protein (c-di-GMP phosphodiesterase class II)
MDTRGLSRRKRVPVSRLKPGVYVVALDQSWFQTPFMFHRRLIKDFAEIELLKKHGIREVVIDIARGLDVDPLSASTAAPAEADHGESKKPSPVTPKARPSSRLEPTLQTVVEELEVGRTIHEEALSIARDILNGVGSGAPINSPAARQVVTNLLSSVMRSPEANLLLVQMRRFKNELFSHCENVCVLSLVVGTFEGLEDEITTLGLGALLHDVGQTRLPRNLTQKNGEFTKTERRIMEQHPGLGALMLKQSQNIPEAARRIVLEHHERLNGSGYPCGLRRSEIAFLSQIVAITDAYDAMLTGRNQLPAPPVEVLRQLYLQGSAGAFDRDLVERVIHGLGVYPIGSLVELNTGERGIVIAPNRADSLKPTLRVVVSGDGLACLNGPIINLAGTNAVPAARRIVRALDPAKEGIDVMAHLRLSAA